MDPNTRITLRSLRNKHLEQIIDVYRSIGMSWSMELPTAGEVRSELSDQTEYELRPTGADISKMILTQRDFKGQEYLHAYITYNRHANAPKDADKLFDQKMREHFIG